MVSRGELIEIGDRFRLPDLLASTGARLREVGTTNRTTTADYAEATGPRTAFILKVHPSNFRIEGFTAAVGVPELAELGETHGVPVVFDIGSGLLAPHPLLPGEPSAATALRDGAALVTASGDKLLGGPQAGLVFGRADLVRRLSPPSAGPRAAGRQAHPGRPGGNPHRTGTAGRRRAGRRPGCRFPAGRTSGGAPGRGRLGRARGAVPPRSAAEARRGWNCPAPR